MSGVVTVQIPDIDEETETMEIATTRVDYALTCRQTSADHYVIEGDGFERIQRASIEGSAEDMLALATAIGRREPMIASRCALQWRYTDEAIDQYVLEGLLWSPRNSTIQTRVTLSRLDGLVPRLRREASR